MPFFERTAEFLTALGRAPRNQQTRAQLEVEAEQELQARIDLGRPGPEEAMRTGPPPEWAVPRPARRPTRPLDVVTVNLDALGATPVVAPPAPSRRARLSRR